ACCLLRRKGARDVERYNHIDLEPHQFGSKLGESIQSSFGGAELICNILPLYMPSSRIPSWNSFLKDCASGRPIKSAPIRANLNCCARASPGHTIAAPLSSVMNSRRFTSSFSRASKRKIALREAYCTAGFRRSLCRLWVKNRYCSGRAQDFRFVSDASLRA